MLLFSADFLTGCFVKNRNETLRDSFGQPLKTYKSGIFSLVTYNIAGLPDFISKSTPSHNTEIISRLLNRFDIALLQEDFYFHKEILKYSRHPYKSKKSKGGLFLTGDGLNRLSNFPFKNYYRKEWRKRYGILTNDSDVLAPKGFSFARHEIFPGVIIDIYNLHMDAGHGEGDSKARKAEAEQLIDNVKEGRTERAVIIAGDWNLKRERPEDLRILGELIKELKLKDVRTFLNAEEDRIDKVLFRNGNRVKFTPIRYIAEDSDFIDEDEKPLSDHTPVSVVFRWEYTP